MNINNVSFSTWWWGVEEMRYPKMDIASWPVNEWFKSIKPILDGYDLSYNRHIDVVALLSDMSMVELRHSPIHWTAPMRTLVGLKYLPEKDIWDALDNEIEATLLKEYPESYGNYCEMLKTFSRYEPGSMVGEDLSDLSMKDQAMVRPLLRKLEAYFGIKGKVTISIQDWMSSKIVSILVGPYVFAVHESKMPLQAYVPPSTEELISAFQVGNTKVHLTVM